MFDWRAKDEGGEFCFEERALEKCSLTCKSVGEKNNKRKKDPAGNKMELFFITVKGNLDEFFFANKPHSILQLSLLPELTVAIVHTSFLKTLGNQKALHASGNIVTQCLSYLHTYSAGIYRRAAGSSLNSIRFLCSGRLSVRSVYPCPCALGSAAESAGNPSVLVNRGFMAVLGKDRALGWLYCTA